MTDVSRSGDVTSDGNGFFMLRPGVRLTEGQRAVIAEYAYIKEQLAGPQFGSPAPQITRIEASDGNVKIFGKHLRGVRVINVAGARMSRARFEVTDDAEPHIEAELPKGAAAGPVTVLTTGGVATGQLRLEDSGATERTTPPPRRRTRSDHEASEEG